MIMRRANRFSVCLCMAAIVCAAASADVLERVMHRYSFEADTSDTIGGADGVLVNNTGSSAYAGGQLTLGNNGSQSSWNATTNGDYVDLPNGLISAIGGQTTFEVWTTWNGTADYWWQRVFDFGASNQGENTSDGGWDTSYIFLTPRGGPGVLRCGYRRELPTEEERQLDSGAVLPNNQQVHLVITWDEVVENTARLYLNGVLQSENTIHFSLPGMIDNNNWLGRAQWNDRMYTGSYNEFRIYDVALTGDEVAASFAAGPDVTIRQLRAIDPVPASGTDKVNVHETLSWTAPPDVQVTGFDVYLATEPNDTAVNLVSAEQAGAVFDLDDVPGELLPGTTYYWRVDVHDANDGGPMVWDGRWWNFTTEPAVPVIVSNPTDTAGGPGDSVSLTAVAEDLGGGVVEYQWFKVVEGSDVAVSGKGPDQGTLTIDNLDIGDEGMYYCIASNAAGETPTATVRLDVQFGLIHRYNFDNDPNDSVGGADAVVVNNTGNARFENAQLVMGNWWHWSNDNNGDYVDLPNGMISALGPQATFEVWVTTTVTNANWSRIFDLGASDAGENSSGGGGNTASIWLSGRGDDGGRFVPMFEYIKPSPRQVRRVVDPQNHWLQHNVRTYYAVVWDEIAGKVTLYTDGQFVADNDLHLKLSELNDINNWLGRAQWNDPLWMGSYHEFRIWDTALSADTVLAHQQAGPDVPMPDDACLDQPASDVNGDCVVDLGDLAVMAAEWLGSGLASDLGAEL